jgi:hypothetical protein
MAFMEKIYESVDRFAQSLDDLLKLLTPPITDLTKVESGWKKVAQKWLNSDFMRYRQAYEGVTKEMARMAPDKNLPARLAYDLLLSFMTRAGSLAEKKEFGNWEFILGVKAVSQYLGIMREQEKEFNSYFTR